MICFAPFTFGLGKLILLFFLLLYIIRSFPHAAHVHHAWDIYNRYGRTWLAARRALLTSGMYKAVPPPLIKEHL